jgi:hypothetical protein
VATRISDTWWMTAIASVTVASDSEAGEDVPAARLGFGIVRRCPLTAVQFPACVVHSRHERDPP